MKAFLIICLAFSASLQCQASELSAHLKQSMECMLKALKTVPGVRHAKQGEFTKNGITSPFLEYRANEKSRWIEPTRFYFDRSNDAFIGDFPGIGPIDTHITDVAVDRWEKACGIKAIVVFN